MTIKNHYELLKRNSIVDEDTGCWIWQRATHVQGYGLARHGGTMKTIQRIMAIELKLFDDINFKTRITNSCDNKLCCNPKHIISLTHTECNERRYVKHGTGGRFSGKEEELRAEYLHMKANKIPRTINKLGEKYNCHPSLVYRAIYRANDMDNIKIDMRKTKRDE